jgi:hypothetical protein
MSGLNTKEINAIEKFLESKGKVELAMKSGLDPLPQDILKRNELDRWLSAHLWFWRANTYDDGKGAGNK